MGLITSALIRLLMCLSSPLNNPCLLFPLCSPRLPSYSVGRLIPPKRKPPPLLAVRSPPFFLASERYFPLPPLDLSQRGVKVSIFPPPSTFLSRPGWVYCRPASYPSSLTSFVPKNVKKCDVKGPPADWFLTSIPTPQMHQGRILSITSRQLVFLNVHCLMFYPLTKINLSPLFPHFPSLCQIIGICVPVGEFVPLPHRFFTS